jgi:hypothetical protein
VAQALDVFGAVPTGPGVWHGHTNARQCVDIRDTADPAVVRDALRAAVDAGMVSPAEAVELWPAGGPAGGRAGRRRPTRPDQRR